MLRPSPLDRQVLAFDVTKFAEPFSKGLVERRNAGRRTGRQKTHTHAFPGRLRTTLLLRLDGERHGEQVRDKGEGEDQRRSPPHGLLPAGLTTYPCREPARRAAGSRQGRGRGSAAFSAPWSPPGGPDYIPLLRACQWRCAGVFRGRARAAWSKPAAEGATVVANGTARCGRGFPTCQPSTL